MGERLPRDASEVPVQPGADQHQHAQGQRHQPPPADPPRLGPTGDAEWAGHDAAQGEHRSGHGQHRDAKQDQDRGAAAARCRGEQTVWVRHEPGYRAAHQIEQCESGDRTGRRRHPRLGSGEPAGLSAGGADQGGSPPAAVLSSRPRAGSASRSARAPAPTAPRTTDPAQSCRRARRRRGHGRGCRTHVSRSARPSAAPCVTARRDGCTSLQLGPGQSSPRVRSWRPLGRADARRARTGADGGQQARRAGTPRPRPVRAAWSSPEG